MQEYIENIIKNLPKDQAEFLDTHRAEFTDYVWDHENWPLYGFFHECAEKYPDDEITKKMLKSLESPGDKNGQI